MCWKQLWWVDHKILTGGVQIKGDRHKAVLGLSSIILYELDDALF